MPASLRERLAADEAYLKLLCEQETKLTSAYGRVTQTIANAEAELKKLEENTLRVRRLLTEVETTVRYGREDLEVHHARTL
jgi:hypothetical protein